MFTRDLSKLLFWDLLFASREFHIPAYLDILPFSSQSLPGVLPDLTLHPPVLTFSPPTPTQLTQLLQLSHPSRFIFHSNHLQVELTALLSDLTTLRSSLHDLIGRAPQSSLPDPLYPSVIWMLESLVPFFSALSTLSPSGIPSRIRTLIASV